MVSPATASGSFFHRHAVALSASLILVATLLAYANTLGVAFYFDDLPIIGNPSLRDLTKLGDVFSPPENTGVRGRPIANLSFALNHALHGERPLGYHVANLAIHLAAALALFALVRRTMIARQSSPLERGGRQAGVCSPEAPNTSLRATMIALATALLWSLHPLTTASVTYVAQRTESLAALFVLLTLYAFAGGWRAFAVAACALAILTKETAVTTPLLVLLYDRTFVAGALRAALARRWKFYLGLAATWLPLFWTLRALHSHSVGYAFGISAFDYALTSCRAIATYLGLVVWPANLVFDYGREVLVRDLSGVVGPLLLVAALLVLTLRELRRHSPLGAALAAFLLLLAPTTSVVPIAMQPIAENRMYLPLAILVATFVAVVAAIRVRGAPFAVGAAALLLGFLTFHRNDDYDYPIKLWGDTVAKVPGNARAHHNLGEAFAACDDARCRVHFRRALEIDPDFVEAHNDLGLVIAPAEAVEHFQTAVRLRPRFYAAWCNLAGALAELGRRDEAIVAYETALRLLLEGADQPAHGLQPDAAALHYNLGNLFFELGRDEKAVARYRDSIQQDPNFAPAHGNLGISLLRLGRRDEARRAFEAALRVEAGYQPALEGLKLLP